MIPKILGHLAYRDNTTCNMHNNYASRALDTRPPAARYIHGPAPLFRRIYGETAFPF